MLSVTNSAMAVIRQSGWISFMRSASTAIYFLLRAVYPPGMGFGDVKLAGVLGMYLGFLGWPHVFAGTFAAFLFGGLWSLALLVSRRGTVKSSIPFGPFMLAGAAAAMALLPAA